MHAIVESVEPSNADVIVILNRSGQSVAGLKRFNPPFSFYGGQDFRLDGGDKLDSCLHSECATLTEYGIQDGVFGFYLQGYKANLPLTADVPYVVSFTRPSQVSAPNTQAAVPTPFTIATPLADQQFADGSSIVVSWAPLGVENTVDIIAEPRCFSVQQSFVGITTIIRRDEDHNGVESLSISDALAAVRAAQASGAPEIYRCDIYVEVVHTRAGIVDAAFHGGEALGRYRQQVRVSYQASQ